MLVLPLLLHLYSICGVMWVCAVKEALCLCKLGTLRLVVFGIKNLKKMAKSIVLYVNDFLLHIIMYAHQFALYANSVRDCEFQNYYFIC